MEFYPTNKVRMVVQLRTLTEAERSSTCFSLSTSAAGANGDGHASGGLGADCTEQARPRFLPQLHRLSEELPRNHHGGKARRGVSDAIRTRHETPPRCFRCRERL